MILKIKPLSVNQAWQGKRFKTPKYSKYQKDVLLMLPKDVKINRPVKLFIEFGFSSKLSDIDNGLKPFIDCLVKKYDFDDREIVELTIKKSITEKKKEFINFNFY